MEPPSWESSSSVREGWFDDGLDDGLDTAGAALALVAAIEPGRVSAMATAPAALAAPAPSVRADIRACPLVRASCRSEPEVAEPIVVL